MSNLMGIPMADDFETTLSSSWNGAVGTINVNATPSGTMPSGKYSYVVVNPGLANMQVAKISGWNSGAKTVTVSSIDVPYGAGGDYTAQTHAANSIVRFSNNYAFWKDIMDAIATKLDEGVFGDFTFTDSAVETPAPMTFSDNETAPVTLKQLATANGADQYFAISENDTTVGHFEDKVTFGDGIKGTKVNPGANEQMDIDIDTADTGVFVSTSSGAVDSGKIAKLDANGKLDGFVSDSSETEKGLVERATDAEVIAGEDTERFLTSKQHKDFGYIGGFTLTPSDNLKISADTERTEITTTYTLKKRINILASGTVRISFDLRGNDTTSAYGRIYINGVAVGTDREVNSSTYVNYSEDLPVATGDNIELYIRATVAKTAYTRNFRIYFDRVSNTTSGLVRTD